MRIMKTLRSVCLEIFGMKDSLVLRESWVDPENDNAQMQDQDGGESQLDEAASGDEVMSDGQNGNGQEDGSGDQNRNRENGGQSGSGGDPDDDDPNDNGGNDHGDSQSHSSQNS
jgi:hypothetical protein